MNHDRMLAILSALANGTDPVTGAVFPAGSPYQQPETVRALFHAVRALEGASTAIATPAAAATEAVDDASLARKPAKSRAAPQGGKPWTSDDDMLLGAGFDAGTALDDLAKALGRSRLSVEIRLAKLGRLAMPANTRYGAGRAAGDAASAPGASTDGPASPATTASPDTSTVPGTAADATRPRYVVSTVQRTPASAKERSKSSKRSSIAGHSVDAARSFDETRSFTAGHSCDATHSCGTVQPFDTVQPSISVQPASSVQPSGAVQPSIAVRSSSAEQWFDAQHPARHPSAPPPADAIEALSRLVARTFTSRSVTP